MSTHVPGFQSFSGVLHTYVLALLANSSIRVKYVKTFIIIGTEIFYGKWENHSLWFYKEKDSPGKKPFNDS